MIIKNILLIYLFYFVNLSAMEQENKFDSDIKDVVKKMVDEILENVINKKMNHKFLQAAREGNLKKLKRLIPKIANINIKDDQGKTALIIASQKGYSLIIAVLIDAGANKYIRDNFGYNAAYYAYSSMHKDAFDLVF